MQKIIINVRPYYHTKNLNKFWIFLFFPGWYRSFFCSLFFEVFVDEGLEILSIIVHFIEQLVLSIEPLHAFMVKSGVAVGNQLLISSILLIPKYFFIPIVFILFDILAWRTGLFFTFRLWAFVTMEFKWKYLIFQQFLRQTIGFKWQLFWWLSLWFLIWRFLQFRIVLCLWLFFLFPWSFSRRNT